MMFLSGFVVLLLALTAEARVGFSEQQPCCETEQCFLFDLVCEANDYENHFMDLDWTLWRAGSGPWAVRDYKPVKWLATLMGYASFDEAVINGSSLLYKYMRGFNEDGTHITQLTNRLVVAVNDSVPGEPTSYELFLLLPAEYQENPPKPTHERLLILTSPDVNMYVRSFNLATPHATAAESFASDLDSLGAKYSSGYHDVVIFHSFSTCDKVYEVMFISVGDPVCVSSKELE